MNQIRTSNPPINQFIVFVLEVIYHFSFVAYNIFFHMRSGQTLGKMFAEVRLLDISEERPPTFCQSFIREIGYIISSFVNLVLLFYLVSTGHNIGQLESVQRSDSLMEMLASISLTISFGWFFLEILTTLSNSKRRAFHDYIANTVVVKVFRD
jgi:uncharacterized RDD family membrane protein YckC